MPVLAETRRRRGVANGQETVGHEDEEYLVVVDMNGVPLEEEDVGMTGGQEEGDEVVLVDDIMEKDK